MNLKDWIDKNCISRRLFSDKLGISKDTLYAWEVGRSRPSYENLKKIIEYTKGEVSIDDFIKQSEGRMAADRRQESLLPL